MILSDYLSRHRQKDLDPSELIPISFSCLEVYRSFIDDRICEDIFCIKTRSRAKASGEQVGEAYMHSKAYFGPPTHVVCDQDPAFTSSLMEAFVTQLNIKVILVSPTNHQSLQAEHSIKSLSGLLVKHLSTIWSWHSVLPYSMLCYNGYSSPNLNSYSPYELVFGHKMTLSHELEIKVDIVVSGTFKDHYEKFKKNLQYKGERLQKFRSQRLDLLNKDREYQAFEVGQIVYMYQDMLVLLKLVVGKSNAIM